MRYGRSRLPEFILVTVFGIGGGFYAFLPAIKQYQQEQASSSSSGIVVDTSQASASSDK